MFIYKILLFFEKIAGFVPFLHAVEMEKAIFLGDYSSASSHVLPIIIYSAVALVVATILFLKQMKK